MMNSMNENQNDQDLYNDLAKMRQNYGERQVMSTSTFGRGYQSATISQE